MIIRAGVKQPFNMNAIKFRMHMSFNAVPGTRLIDRRATLTCRVCDMDLSERVCAYIRTIAGGHYIPRTDTIVISVDKHEDAVLNKRVATEQLIQLVNTSMKMYETHGEFKGNAHFLHTVTIRSSRGGATEQGARLCAPVLSLK